MCELLLQFERHIGLSAAKAAMLLGYARPTYYQYRRTGVLPDYAVRHIQALMLLPMSDLKSLIQEHVEHDDL